VQSATGLDSGQNAHAFFLCHVERSGDISNCLIGCRVQSMSRDSSTSLGMTTRHVQDTAGLNTGQDAHGSN
jgi:hypothetical protein